MTGSPKLFHRSNFRTECPGPHDLARNTQIRKEVVRTTTTGASYKPTLHWRVNMYQESDFSLLLLLIEAGLAALALSQHLSSGLPRCVFKVAREPVMRSWTLIVFGDIWL